MSSPPWSLTARWRGRFPAAEPEGQGNRHGDGAEDERKGHVHDIVGDAHRRQAQCQHQTENREARDTGEADGVFAGAQHGPVGQIGQPEADQQDADAQQHVAVELDEQPHQHSDLGEVEPVGGLDGGEQHGEEDRDAADQLRGLETVGEDVRQAHLGGQMVQTGAVQQIGQQTGRKTRHLPGDQQDQHGGEDVGQGVHHHAEHVGRGSRDGGDPECV